MLIFKALIELFFMRQCVHCSTSLMPNECDLCLCCNANLSPISFSGENDPELAQLFYGRSKISGATALFHFVKGGVSQSLIHQFKYYNSQKIGTRWGIKLAHHLKKANDFSDIDVVIPVPMTRQKKRKRGYNQSEKIAKSLAKELKVKYDTRTLKRKTQKRSQTHLNKYTRWQNINEGFELIQPLAENVKHVLLIDDVITTGATLESCANLLAANRSIKISIASLAFAPLEG